MDKLSEAMRKMRGTRRYDEFRKGLGYKVLARSTEVTNGWNGWHPHIHEVWFLDPMESEWPIVAMSEERKRDKRDKNSLERLVADEVFETWENACGKVFGSDRLPTREHGVDVTVCWSANDYLTKLPDHAKRKAEAGKARWAPSTEMTKTTPKKARRGSRTFWELLPIAVGDGPSLEEQKAANQRPLTQKQAVALVRDYAAGTWRKRRMFYTPSRTDKYGEHVPGFRELFDLGEELTDKEIAQGDVPMTTDQSQEERERIKPVRLKVDLELISLRAIGRAYLDALQDRMAPKVVRDDAGKSVVDRRRGPPCSCASPPSVLEPPS